MHARPRRSALYMPGSNARALDKARGLPADVLILDLEDAVAPDAKEPARSQVAAAVAARGYGHREVTVRINGADTPWHSDDLAAVVKARPDAVVVPKVETPDDVLRVAARLDAANIPSSVRVWAMMETPRAVLNAHEIAATAVRKPESRLSMLVIGTNDLAKATRTEIVPDRWTMLPWLMTFVAAARAYGLEILDGAYNNFRDESGLRRETEQGREMGMDGKTLIHPDQVLPCNQIFTPSPAEVSEARRIIAAFEKPENKGKGVISVDGKMVELLHADMARRTVAIAEAVGALPSA